MFTYYPHILWKRHQEFFNHLFFVVSFLKKYLFYKSNVILFFLKQLYMTGYTDDVLLELATQVDIVNTV